MILALVILRAADFFFHDSIHSLGPLGASFSRSLHVHSL
jgi:hypothetical protein